MIQDLFSALSTALTHSLWLALASAFFWSVLSILLSPCHLAIIPLVIGLVMRGEEKTTGVGILAAFRPRSLRRHRLFWRDGAKGASLPELDEREQSRAVGEKSVRHTGDDGRRPFAGEIDLRYMLSAWETRCIRVQRVKRQSLEKTKKINTKTNLIELEMTSFSEQNE
jgi:hypothetical protein